MDQPQRDVTAGGLGKSPFGRVDRRVRAVNTHHDPLCRLRMVHRFLPDLTTGPGNPASTNRDTIEERRYPAGPFDPRFSRNGHLTRPRSCVRAASCCTEPRHSTVTGRAFLASEVSAPVRPLIRRCRRWPRYTKGNSIGPSAFGHCGASISRSFRVSSPVKHRCSRSTLPAMAARWMPSDVVPPWISAMSEASTCTKYLMAWRR